MSALDIELATLRGFASCRGRETLFALPTRLRALIQTALEPEA